MVPSDETAYSLCRKTNLEQVKQSMTTEHVPYDPAVRLLSIYPGEIII